MKNTEPVSVAWGGTIWIKLDSAQWLLRQMKISERKVLCLLHSADALRAIKRHACVDTRVNQILSAHGRLTWR